MKRRQRIPRCAACGKHPWFEPCPRYKWREERPKVSPVDRYIARLKSKGGT